MEEEIHSKMERVPGTATYAEIVSQPTAWAEAVDVVVARAEELRQLLDASGFEEVVFTGCGSSYYLSLAAAALWQELLALPARGVPAGELCLYPAASYPASTRRTLLVAVSRSGTTTETVTAVQRFRQGRHGDVVTISNDPHSVLAGLGDVLLAIPAGQEESVAQTRSFASMYVAVTAMVLALAEEAATLEALPALPEAGQALLKAAEPLVRQWGEDLGLDRFYFLGSGPRYGLACEANLKMKEMTLTHSEPFHFLEFRHGPMSMVTNSAAIVGFLSDAHYQEEMRVLREMAELGGRVLSLAEDGADLSFRSGLPRGARNVLYLPPLQLMAYYRALAKGLDPDRPQNLSAVVSLDLAP